MCVDTDREDFLDAGDVDEDAWLGPDWPVSPLARPREFRSDAGLPAAGGPRPEAARVALVFFCGDCADVPLSVAVAFFDVAGVPAPEPKLPCVRNARATTQALYQA